MRYTASKATTPHMSIHLLELMLFVIDCLQHRILKYSCVPPTWSNMVIHGFTCAKPKPLHHLPINPLRTAHPDCPSA